MGATNLRLRKPVDVGIVLSYNCQNNCKHCIYNCGPGWREWMTIDDLRLALEIAEVGVPRYVETNAGWCLRSDLVRQRFHDLHESGLQAILISCSPFHAENIPLQRTLLAIDTAIEEFGFQRVFVYLAEWIEYISRFSVAEGGLWPDLRRQGRLFPGGIYGAAAPGSVPGRNLRGRAVSPRPVSSGLIR